MNIFCNGESRALPDSSTLQNLLQDLGCARAGVAVAVNDAIVPMARWNGEPTLDIEIQRSCTLKHQDRPILTT